MPVMLFTFHAYRSWTEDNARGYLQRGAHMLPRQGREFPWRSVQDYKHDKKALLSDPIDDGVLSFETAHTKEPVPA